MSARTVKHQGKEITVKVINEEIQGLIIDDSKSHLISEAFGWPDEKFEKVIKTFKAYYDFQEAAEELDQDLPRITKISVFADFLKSASFKKLGIKLEKPNDYLLLGSIFAITVVRRGVENDLPKIAGGMMNGRELIELLKHLADHDHDKDS